MMENHTLQNECTVGLMKENCSMVNINNQCNDSVHSNEDVDGIDTNGDVKNSVCDILPNNNECENLSLSQCRSETDCVTSEQSDAILLQNLHNLYHGESRSAHISSHADLPLPMDTECSTSASTENSLPEESTSAHSYDEENSAASDTTDKQTTESSLEEVSNGAIKKSRKRRNAAVSGSGRGRPRKAIVAMYHSQISGDKNTIKIRIKKSNFSPIQVNPQKKKSGRRKRHKQRSDTDLSDYETSNKRNRVNAAKLSNVNNAAEEEPKEQSVWGQSVPYKALYRVFQYMCVQEGCLPVLVRLCRVCKLWREVALSPGLWNKVDLNWVQEKFRTDLRFQWLLQNRLKACQDVNLGEWKVRDIQVALEALNRNCSELKGLNISGWKGLNADNIKYISSEFQKLEKLDLSSINSTSAINSQPLVNLALSMSSRLTHLVLAHNKIAGFTQIMSAIAANCPNLQLLDISNIRTFAHTKALLNVEQFQSGCPKLRVLRITNSQIWLAPVRLSEQASSPGFTMLEELSVAGLEDDQTTTARSLDDDGIERLLKNSKKLRLLDVRGCIKLSDSGLVRVPAWDLEHLFLSGCYITRVQSSGLELIIQKWSHSLVEVDLAWSTATASLDAAVLALAEKESESRLRILNLCGSSVSLDPIKAVLTKCPKLHSINLQSCRALPRGIKRLYTGAAVRELKQSLEDKLKTESGDADAEQLQGEKSPAV